MEGIIQHNLQYKVFNIQNMTKVPMNDYDGMSTHAYRKKSLNDKNATKTFDLPTGLNINLYSMTTFNPKMKKTNVLLSQVSDSKLIDSVANNRPIQGINPQYRIRPESQYKNTQLSIIVTKEKEVARQN